MAQVLTTGATITCAHQGTVGLSSDSKLKVSGVQVLLQNGLGSISGCIQPNDTSKGTAQDMTASATGTLSLKLMSNGSPVLVTPLSALGSGLPAPSTLTASEPQTKLVAS
jgi:hypothetical protein